MKTVVLSQAAARDMEGHLSYVAEENPKAADRMLGRLHRAFAALSIFPLAGRDLNFRRKFPVPGTTLVLLYRVREERVEITRCLDGRTNWKRDRNA